MRFLPYELKALQALKALKANRLDNTLALNAYLLKSPKKTKALTPFQKP